MSKIKSIAFYIVIIGMLFVNINTTYALTTIPDEQNITLQDCINELIDIRNTRKELENEIDNLNISTQAYNQSSAQKVVTINLMSTSDDDMMLNHMDTLNNKLQELLIVEVQMIKYIEQETKAYLEANDLEIKESIWPIEGYDYISSYYGQRIHPISGILSFHEGIDIPAPEGTDILAIDDGIVTFSGIKTGYGNIVEILHFDGKASTYAHNSENVVEENEVVLKGQTIGKVGSTGNSTGNHLHLEIQMNDNTINPMETVYLD